MKFNTSLVYMRDGGKRGKEEEKKGGEKEKRMGEREKSQSLTRYQAQPKLLAGPGARGS